MMRYNGYVYIPGGRNVFEPKELDNLRRIDQRIDSGSNNERKRYPESEEARKHRLEAQKLYREQNRERIMAKDRERHRLRYNQAKGKEDPQ